MKDNFEISLLETSEFMKRGAEALINNIGKAIATITLIITMLILFCDVGFADITSENFTSTSILMIIASYLMYFSMEDAGEKLGEGSEEYKNSLSKYLERVEKVSGDMIGRLRDFCKKYSVEELKYRRLNLLMQCGFSEEDYEAFEEGKDFSREAKRTFRKVQRLRAYPLTPNTLLERESAKSRRELANPEKKKILEMLFKLLPTTICMTVTVSIMLSARADMSFAVIVDGLLKLSALFIVGFRGYSLGYVYKKRNVPMWLDAKTRILDGFLAA